VPEPRTTRTRRAGSATATVCGAASRISSSRRAPSSGLSSPRAIRANSFRVGSSIVRLNRLADLDQVLRQLVKVDLMARQLLLEALQTGLEDLVPALGCRSPKVELRDPRVARRQLPRHVVAPRHRRWLGNWNAARSRLLQPAPGLPDRD